MKRVMLIGDSIRLNYQSQVQENLKDSCYVWGSENNCRFAKYTLNELERLQEEFSGQMEQVSQEFLMPVSGGKKELIRPDVIHWNNGLWDTAIVCKEDGAFTPLEEYLSYMAKILRELRKITDHVIFATTTPVKPHSANQDNEIITRYNEAIVAFMKEQGVPVNDLNALVSADMEQYICQDCIHLSEAGKKLCADAVSEWIKSVF